ncbi:MAG: hypothetical protein ACYC9Z_16395 [Casimicrobiaceae bacterium]
MKTAPALPRALVAHFASLRRQLDHPGILTLTRRIETLYRVRFALADRSDDEIVQLTLDRRGQTTSEIAALHVVRACIGMRESGGDAHWLDLLEHAIYEADADKVLGTDQRARVRAGGAKTAATRQKEALARDKELKGAAEKLRTQNPRLSRADLARLLADRGHGGAAAIRKKLIKLLS